MWTEGVHPMWTEGVHLMWTEGVHLSGLKVFILVIVA
jgi:hypothetical protein